MSPWSIEIGDRKSSIRPLNCVLDLGERIGKWLRDVEKFGLVNSVDTTLRRNEEASQHFKRRLPTFCICDPFSGQRVQDADLDYRVELLDAHEEERSVGVVGPGDKLAGEATLAVVRRASRFVLGGRWRNGFREGRGSVGGPGLESNFGVELIVGNYRRGRLEGWQVTFTPLRIPEWGTFSTVLLALGPSGMQS